MKRGCVAICDCWTVYLAESLMNASCAGEEYSPDLSSIKGENNVVPDTLSRLEIAAEPLEEFTAEQSHSEWYHDGTETLTSSNYPLEYEQIQQAQLKDKQGSNMRPVHSMQPEKH